jgi:hypothetical protein
VFSEGESTLTIADIKPYGTCIPPETLAQKPGFFPFIDKYGQYKHGDWPGKTNSDEEMKESFLKETKELALIPSPEDRNQYGSWIKGPRLEATGHFRTEKHNGKWWFVDPEGYLFWSHGMTCVRFINSNTRVAEREQFFEWLPSEDDPLYSFINSSREGTHYDFYRANLYRKFGKDWEQISREHVLKRMKSWGMNTHGNWSDPAIFQSDINKFPYTVSGGSRAPRIDGKSKGFPDVFDPRFQEGLASGLQRLAVDTKDDPLCIGYFIDNELSITDLTVSLMEQPAEGYAKQAFIAYLQNKYT